MNGGPGGKLADQRCKCLMLENTRDTNKSGDMSSDRKRRNSVPKGISSEIKLSDPSGKVEKEAGYPLHELVGRTKRDSVL